MMKDSLTFGKNRYFQKRMSRASITKPQTSMSMRSKGQSSIIEVPTRPTTRQRNSRSQDLKPAQIHQLKLQTQQIKHQTKVLRTQLKRTEFKISSHTNSINKTFEQSSEKPPAIANHANTIVYLKQNLDGAQNTLDTLKEQVKEAENDDKSSLVDELEEELKITYCEYRRLVRDLQEKKSEANHYDRQLNEVEYRASNQHISELKAAIRDIRAQNSGLRDKAQAYQVKIEKIKIEQNIKKHQDEKVDLKTTQNNIELEITDLHDKINALCDELNKEAEQHDQNVAELTNIIEEMRMKIIKRLNEKDEEANANYDEAENQEAE